MLVRFLIKNLYSFKELTEFNMLPGRFSRMPHHVYSGEVGLLKLNAMYGANGAGKSNLIKALANLSAYVRTGVLPIDFYAQTFKLDKEGKSQDVYLGIEFIKDDVPYYYGITLNQGLVVEEELIMSGLGKKADYLLFSRKGGFDGKGLILDFSDEVMEDEEAVLFPMFLTNEVLGRSQPVLFHMALRRNPAFDPMKSALQWLSQDLVPLLPNSKPADLILGLDRDPKFNVFANEMMRAFNTGITGVGIETISIEAFFGEDDKQQAEQIAMDLRANPDLVRSVISMNETVSFVLEADRVVAKRLYFMHDLGEEGVRFYASEESDGTRRLLDYLPAFYTAINYKRVYLIDEIERSVHPLLIKELINKFSQDESTKGQLIFSTHESNLLDQDIFRPDEIWFAEKNKEGATELYSLSEFKEHHTIDIRKGYLSGRYGGIPFLGNLKDLKWEVNAETR